MQSTPNNETRNAVSFGPFTLSVAGRSLEKHGVAVPIGGRALEILVALVEAAGTVVSHRDLRAKVWPNTVIAEGALRVHINKLRHVLGEGEQGARYIQNVAGRGYCFVAPVQGPPADGHWNIREPRWTPRSNLPHRPSRMVGRDAVVSRIAADILSHRFVTIVGPGGVGKTTVCAAVCHGIVNEFGGNVIFVDLGAISEAELTFTTIRSALNLPATVRAMSGMLAALKDHRVLLVLDCCEHVAAEVALIAECVFREAPGTHLMLTSREPLHCEGERVHNLPPLEFPNTAELQSTDAVMAFPAARLFIDCVIARDQDFRLQDADAPVVASICRRVDGIALALELAAGRVNAFGLREVNSLLDGRMKLLWQGRRTAPPRQQTLHATLDWSFKLLSEQEQTLLCRLSVFVGAFTFDDAKAVVADEMLAESEMAHFLDSLVDRSLIAADLSGRTPQYRLLDITRQFARGKIGNEQEMNNLARSHARYFLRVLKDGADSRSDPITGHQGAQPSNRLGNVHAALEWCFSENADSEINLGIRLAAASGKFLMSQGLTVECRKWTETAISQLGSSEFGTQLELDLQILLASALMLGDYAKRTAIIDRALMIASDLGQKKVYLSMLFQRLYDQAYWGEPEAALKAAINSRKDISDTADPIELAIAEATIACLSFTFGADLAAHRHFGLAFMHLRDAGDQASGSVDEQFFRRVTSAHANNLCSCGFLDQAAALGQTFIDQFERTQNFPAYSEVMIQASFIFEFRREFEKVAQIYNRFSSVYMGQPSDGVARPYAVMRCKLLMEDGKFNQSIAKLAELLAEIPFNAPDRFIYYVPLADGLSKVGRYEEALAIIDQGLSYEATFPSSGYRSEYMLCRARILSSFPEPEVGIVEATLRLSLEAARRQTSLCRELDAAVALADLLGHENRLPEALAILKPVYQRFSEGFGTKILMDARRLLDRLGDEH